MIRAILIDDEPKALEILHDKLLKLFPEIRVEGLYADPSEAEKEMDETNPDIVFLDISMPQMNGLEWLASLPERNFEVIFVTAYDEYAIEAFKHAAVGYVLKPLEEEELRIAVTHALENLKLKKSNDSTALEQLLGSSCKFISIPSNSGYKFLRKNRIIRLESDGSYTKIYYDDGAEFVSSYHLKKIVDVLPRDLFFQSHRSHVINMEYVAGIHKNNMIELENGHMVPLSRTRRKAFFEMISRF